MFGHNQLHVFKLGEDKTWDLGENPDQSTLAIRCHIQGFLALLLCCEMEKRFRDLFMFLSRGAGSGQQCD